MRILAQDERGGVQTTVVKFTTNASETFLSSKAAFHRPSISSLVSL